MGGALFVCAIGCNPPADGNPTASTLASAIETLRKDITSLPPLPENEAVASNSVGILVAGGHEMLEQIHMAWSSLAQGDVVANGEAPKDFDRMSLDGQVRLRLLDTIVAIGVRESADPDIEARVVRALISIGMKDPVPSIRARAIGKTSLFLIRNRECLLTLVDGLRDSGLGPSPSSRVWHFCERALLRSIKCDEKPAEYSTEDSSDCYATWRSWLEANEPYLYFSEPDQGFVLNRAARSGKTAVDPITGNPVR